MNCNPTSCQRPIARGLGLSACVPAQAGLRKRRLGFAGDLSAGVPVQVDPSGPRLGGESARGLIRLENRDPPKRHA